MNKPVRTTLVFGLLSALLMVPVLWYQRSGNGWPQALQLAIWFDLAVYAMLLCRWSRTRPAAVLFPLALLLGAALWPRANTGFILMALGIFSWVRSGICFRAAPLRALMAELTSTLGGGLLVAIWWPHSVPSWAVAVWLFFLLQSVYFFIIPGMGGLKTDETHADPFEHARREAERVLEGR